MDKKFQLRFILLKMFLVQNLFARFGSSSLFLSFSQKMYDLHTTYSMVHKELYTNDNEIK